MFPILLELGPFSIHSLWFFVTIGIITGAVFFTKLAKRYRLKLDFLSHHGLAITLITIAASRLLYILFNITEFHRFAQLFQIWDRGLSFWGGLLGLTFSFAYFAKKYRESYFRIFDVMTPAILLGLLFGHIGTFLDGMAHGTATNLPLGITFQSAVVKYAVPIHPTQLYAFFYTLALLIIILKMAKYWTIKAEGFTALFTVWTYSLLRFLEEFFRGDDTLMLFSIIRVSQIVTFFVFAILTWYLLIKTKEPLFREILEKTLRWSLRKFVRSAAEGQKIEAPLS